jgi:hypothetical protein
MTLYPTARKQLRARGSPWRCRREDGRLRPPAGSALRVWRNVSQRPQQHGHDGAGRRHASPIPPVALPGSRWLRSWLRVVLVVVAIATAGCAQLLGPTWAGSCSQPWVSVGYEPERARSHRPTVASSSRYGSWPWRPRWPSPGDADSDSTAGSACATPKAAGTANAASAESNATLAEVPRPWRGHKRMGERPPRVARRRRSW